MKILGLLLILGALVGGGLILSDTVPGYFRNKDYLARAYTEADVAQAKLETVAKTAATASQIDQAIRSAEQATDSIRYAKDGVARRRNESLLFGAGTLAVLALGTFLFLRGRRKSSAAPVMARAALAA